MSHSKTFLALVNKAKQEIKEITITDTKAKFEKKEDFVFVDTREDREWEKGSLPNAIHLGKGIIERDIESTVPDKNKCIILYCGGGFRSALAAQNLQLMGYTNVFSMAGGYREWNE
ncbi:sulfurtransferase [bacterium K02(2017)]|nr:sulfurtransferase [bacterium K02(2017)]